MAGESNTRLVYSTGPDRRCPTCGSAAGSCHCAKTGQDETVPGVVTAKLRIEKAGRGGKTVTVVYDLPRHPVFLKALAAELKKACGVGGAVQETAVEVQGDQRERVREWLLRKGYRVKG